MANKFSGDNPATPFFGDPGHPKRYTLRTGQAPWFSLGGLGQGFHLIVGRKRFRHDQRRNKPTFDGYEIEVGRFWSTKNDKSLWFRSGLERRWYEALETDPDVIGYESEPCSIPYSFLGKSRFYHPDLMVHCVRQCVLLVEIKHSRFSKNPKDDAKFAAAREWCDKMGIKFRVWTTDPKSGIPKQPAI